MHVNLKKKEVIVSGGSKGIGLSIVKKFIKEDYKVIVLSRSCPKYKNKNLFWYKIDLTNEIEIKNSIIQIQKNFFNIEIIINNVGESNWMPISKVTKKFLDKMFQTNLYSCIYLIKHFVPYFKKRKYGNIINISSIAGKRGTANNSIYCATKFGMNGITQSLSKELGIFNIRVNGVCPVLIKTPGLVKAMKKKYSPSYQKRDFFKNFIKYNTALSKLPSEKDVTDLVYFLSSKESSSITGQSINIDCGVLPQ